MMTLQQGQVINKRYRIVRLLGKGGFGAVYRAWDINLKGPCAIKENFDTSPAAQEQFNREAKMLFTLRNASLPKVFDAFSIPNQGQYLVMEFIEGEDLGRMLDRTLDEIPESQALTWILQISDALVYMHSQDPPIIHRDVKPGNIRITPQGRAMLVDFGIAKKHDPSVNTDVGARAITPGYSPPEQYGLGATDEQSDVYALGATLYSLLTGREPNPSVDVAYGNASKPADAHIVNPSVSPEVSKAVAHAMQFDRRIRYKSILDFRSDLQKAISHPLEAGLVARQEDDVRPVVYAAEKEQLSLPVESKTPSPRATRVGLWMGIFAVALLAFCLVVGGLAIFSNIRTGARATTQVDHGTLPPELPISATTTLQPEGTLDFHASETAQKITQVASSAKLTSTQLSSAQATNTSDGNQQGTVQAGSMQSLIRRLFSQGLLSSTQGTYTRLEDFDESWAQTRWFESWETGYSPENYAIQANTSWDSASDKANWHKSGCGFVFGYQGEEYYHVIHLGLDGTVYLDRLYGDKWTQIAQQGYGQVSIPDGDANVLLVVDGAKVLYFVNNKLVVEVRDHLLKPGELHLTVMSGTAKDFGTRCEMTDIDLWIFE